jgi:predicted nucleic acid-binding protein
VIFWDSSALLPLLVPEAETARAVAWILADDAMVAWWGTPVECASALARLVREGALGRDESAVAADRMALLHAAWVEVQPSENVRGHATRLLRRHPLRAADALQLGAAMVWAHDRPAGQSFATLDVRLAEAAHGEGFRVLS